VNAISFFTGAGGLDMGIQQAGFNVRLCVELEPKYCKTLSLNHPTWNVKCGDIMLYNKQRVYEEAGLKEGEDIDLVFGGSPCQSFSTAGLRQAFDDPRGQAMLKYAALIEELQPKVFLLENVRGLLSVALKHTKINQRGKDSNPLKEEELPGSALKYILTKFNSYDVQYKLICAANYGVPQKRERVFIIGTRKDLKLKYVYPKETYSKNGGRGKHKWIPISAVFDKLKSLKNQTYVTYSSERLKYMKIIPKGGGNWRDLPPEIAKEAMGGAYYSGGGKVGFFRRLKIDEPSPTLLTTPHQKSTNLGHPFEDRPLSIEEYLEIQGFPQNYELFGSLTDKYTQVGNAVPVQLAYIMGKSIKNILEK
jgi:DNA (cytosine-5)-methyltransferase 1